MSFCKWCTQRKRTLYLTLVRSQVKFEALQKKCINWILSEEELSYRSNEVYIRKCKHVNIIPHCQRFKLNDMVLFYKIFSRLMPEELHSYLALFSGHTRLRSLHLDRLCSLPSILSRGPSNYLLEKSFFYRSHISWNSLPLHIREFYALLNSNSEF